MIANKNSSMVNKNWYVITGGPSTGKTTVINLLHKLGYNTGIRLKKLEIIRKNFNMES